MMPPVRRGIARGRCVTPAASNPRGQSLPEYLIVAAVVTTALFSGEPSVAARLVAALRSFYRALSFALSLP